MHQGSFYRLMDSTKTLVDRYLVLSSKALLVYKDNLAYKAFPEKPIIKISISEIEEVKQT